MADRYAEDMETLEGIVDGYSPGLSTVVAMLAEIARGKAEHLRSSWQDPATAKLYDQDAGKLEAVSLKLND